ncbi:TetR family transcriptional regulator [Kaistia sp. 32K]|uniref:TetR/AcrR family transcriptional regulator n=1 Tax=Kaistia sp. 32K TaxID=2795690 RepID=UPI001915D85A|nr:TetR/AcrR family transcriptional regulator [Kaistia sp. 32K]BCP54519.1 TetR family transcriptional regulator [Kaistia sp. 32K]
MARPLSEEKREAILAAAVELVATQGTGAPTAKIAREAGVAEGTLFTYFATKDELLNQLFLEIEAELAAALLDGYPVDGTPRERTRHLWDRLIDWGAANPAKRKVLRQLKVSDRITEGSRCSAGELFQEISAMLEQNLADHASAGQTVTYVGAILDSLAETTLEFILNDPEQREPYKKSGFEIFWKGIAR